MNKPYKATLSQHALPQFLPTWGGKGGVEDPMFEKYPSISPYTYCANNPMKYVDPTGGYYFKPPSKNNSTRYKAMVTNYKWVNLVSKMTAIPYLGLMYEGMLGIQRIKDPSFNATISDYVGLGLQMFGIGSMKILKNLGKIDGLGEFLLGANRQLASSMMSALSNPKTSEITLEYMAIRGLEQDGLGKVYGNSSNNVQEYIFSFYETVTKEIEKDILSDKNLTSQKDFNLEKEVIKRLNTIIDNKKEEIRKTLIEE